MIALLAAVLSSGVPTIDLPLRQEGVTLKVSVHANWYEIEVLAVEGDPASVTFLQGRAEGAWCLPLNYRTRVVALPGSGVLNASAYAKTGIIGARVAVVPRQPDIRRTLAEVVGASELWKNGLGGPAALDHPDNGASYLMALPEPVTRTNVEAWIELCRRARINQIDWVHSFRYGDYAPRTDYYPNGWHDVAFLVETLRQAGIKSILHSYSMAIASDSPLAREAGAKSGPQGYRLPGDANLLDKVAAALAYAIDRGGFAGVYFDALDWANDVEGREWGWYWAARFVHETGSRLVRRDLMVETSMFGAAIWPVTSRYGALDYAGDDWKAFVDRHAKELHPEYLLWGTMGWMPTDGTRDVGHIDYLLNRAREVNSGVSWRGLTPRTFSQSPWQRTVVECLGRERTKVPVTGERPVQ
jgi:hypothetical protein